MQAARGRPRENRKMSCALKLSLHEIIVSGCMMLKETVLALHIHAGHADQGNFGAGIHEIERRQDRDIEAGRHGRTRRGGCDPLGEQGGFGLQALPRVLNDMILHRIEKWLHRRKSPALCAVLLKRGERSVGIMRHVLGVIDAARDGYVAVVRRLAPVAIVAVAIVVGVVAASVALFSVTPKSFLPDEDQGAIFAALRLPEGASINRTEAVVKQVEDCRGYATAFEWLTDVSCGSSTAAPAMDPARQLDT